MKKFLLLIVALVPFIIYGDDSSSNDFFSKKKSAFDRIKDKKDESWTKNRSEKDEAFNQALTEAWEEFEAKVEEFDMTPKPIRTPEKQEKEFTPIDTTPVDIDIKEDEKPEIIPEKDYEFSSDTKKIKIDFYLDKLEFQIPRIDEVKFKKLNDREISKNWERLTSYEYAPLITQVENEINRYNLNPWGSYQLVKALSESITRDKNSRILIQSFILNQIGHDCKIGYSGKRSFLLLPSVKPLYGKAYLTIDEKKFYIIEDSGKRINKVNTYKVTFPGADKDFDLTVYNLPNLKEKIKTKELKFNYMERDYKVEVSYNANLVTFYENYPQTHYENYFNSKLYSSTKISLLKSLKPLVKDKSEAEAVNIILHFTQKSFDYKTDQEQFRREKPLFPEEVLHYRYSDCEDRAVLFSYLVQELLGLKTVGLKYPGHMATAVELSTPVGDRVKYKGRVYTVADPTYINANIGDTMPNLKNSKPEIIGVN